MTEQIEEAKRLLAEAGFKMEVGGCGCCGSPWVKLSHNERLVIFDEEDRDSRYDVHFNMFQDETNNEEHKHPS